MAILESNAVINGIKGIGKGFEYLMSNNASPQLRRTMAKDIGRTALIGAGAGAALGAVSGAVDKDRTALQGAARGAMIGGATGGIFSAGYTSGTTGYLTSGGKVGIKPLV